MVKYRAWGGTDARTPDIQRIYRVSKAGTKPITVPRGTQRKLARTAPSPSVNTRLEAVRHSRLLTGEISTSDPK